MPNFKPKTETLMVLSWLKLNILASKQSCFDSPEVKGDTRIVIACFNYQESIQSKEYKFMPTLTQ